MAKPPKETICHVTDAGNVVHLAMVKRHLTKDRVLSFSVSTACAPKIALWDSRFDSDGTFATELPQGFDLPKKVTEAGLLVKYEPESPLAPAITCMRCSAFSQMRDLWRL